MSDPGETDDPSRDESAESPLNSAEFDDSIEGELDGSEIVDPVAMISNAKRRHGALGGVLAAGMLGLDQALGRKVREEAPVVVDANSDPVDLDTDGISIAVADDTDVVSPPLPRTPPVTSNAKRRRR
jgi:hypothetical protein